MLGLEIIIGLGVAIVAAFLLTIFIAIIIGLVKAAIDTIVEEKNKK